ncbi:transmembrane protein 138 isoform X1 [Pelodiscus sinensis]|uniref:transmembrane protein 138 isoform X1 n=2 Tax=Pelodiscus sinensis TaxID=13735 RepID=UPI000D720AA8|nr:transmembrane protein 138 isoform X1 [Pelodiscus sinensis]|eukprot:XP_025041571.1 transmembrane protein 138 isoform X1 [Pelodiscus sinensis]
MKAAIYCTRKGFVGRRDNPDLAASPPRGLVHSVGPGQALCRPRQLGRLRGRGQCLRWHIGPQGGLWSLEVAVCSGHLSPHSIQDIAILFNIIIIFLMFFNTFVFQAGLVNLLFHKFKGTIILSAAYLALSIAFHVWVMNLRWKNSTRFVWTDGLQALFVFQRLAAVLYCYFYKRTALHLGDPRFYQDSLWLRKEFAHIRS